MSWKERHLNWTWFLISLLAAPFIGGIGALTLGLADPDLEKPATYIITFSVMVGITVWYLKRKNRGLGNLAWLIVPFGIIVLLCFKNLSSKPPTPHVIKTQEEKHENRATESQDKEKEYEQNVWEIYRKEWATASSEKRIELNKRMLRWQELMKSGLTASQAYYRAMPEDLNKGIEEQPDKPTRYSRWSWMPKVASAVLAIAVIVAVIYGVAVTKERDALNTKLESVQSVLASTQAQLSSTKQTLTSTQSELGSTKQTLASTKQSLTLTQADLGSTKQTLTSTKTELSRVNSTLASVQSDLLATKTKMDAIDAKLKLYEDTMGIKIFSGVQPLARGAGPIELVNNLAATNPTWQQLMPFLLADPADDRTWTEGIFVSGDFAEMLHNNAEAAGIRAALVGVFFEGETIGHGLNAFKTTDRGLVYVEPQSDTIAYVTKGKEYGTVSLSQNLSFDYSYYEKLKADWNSYDQKLEAYNRDVQAFNREIFGKVYYIGTTEWFRIKEWESTLEAQKRVLDALRAQLKDLGKPMGIVESIEIYW